MKHYLVLMNIGGRNKNFTVLAYDREDAMKKAHEQSGVVDWWENYMYIVNPYH